MLRDQDEAAKNTYKYSAFGVKKQESTTVDNPFTFIGSKGYFDNQPIGLYSMSARYYDPVTARFLSKDPKGFDAGDENLYRYVENNPVNEINPSGLFEFLGESWTFNPFRATSPWESARRMRRASGVAARRTRKTVTRAGLRGFLGNSQTSRRLT